MLVQQAKRGEDVPDYGASDQWKRSLYLCIFGQEEPGLKECLHQLTIHMTMSIDAVKDTEGVSCST